MGFIVFGILLIFFGIILFMALDNDNTSKILGLFLCTFGGGTFMAGVCMECPTTSPTAMDVYQGKTTLQITYKDSIPVDSIVVFKEKEK